MKGTVDFYNRTACNWAESGYTTESEMPALLNFAKKFKAGCRFLDLCCGCGYDSARIHALGYEVIGIDFSEESLKIAREKNPDIVFYNDNMLNDYSYIGTVDAIFVIAGLVHIESNELKQAFSHMRNVMNENGYVFLTIWEGKGRISNRSVTVIDGDEYDRNFIGHTLDELMDASDGLFSYVEEVAYDGSKWHNYIFKCI